MQAEQVEEAAAREEAGVTTRFERGIPRSYPSLSSRRGCPFFLSLLPALSGNFLRLVLWIFFAASASLPTTLNLSMTLSLSVYLSFSFYLSPYIYLYLPLPLPAQAPFHAPPAAAEKDPSAQSEQSASDDRVAPGGVGGGVARVSYQPCRVRSGMRGPCGCTRKHAPTCAHNERM